MTVARRATSASVVGVIGFHQIGEAMAREMLSANWPTAPHDLLPACRCSGGRGSTGRVVTWMVEEGGGDLNHSARIAVLEKPRVVST